MMLSLNLMPFRSSEQFGIALFLLSTVLISSKRSRFIQTLLRVNTTTRLVRSISTEKLELEYIRVLQTLFKPVKNPSRHSTDSLTTNQIFIQRKKFFQDLIQALGLTDCKVVHVAGTKGKGSTCEYISSALMAAGHTVGVFTSPHLHTARERIRINRELISMSDMVLHGQTAINLLSSTTWPVFFDYIFATALLHFAEHKPEYLVMECGVGGRYDSTNVFDHPAASVITSISIDHQAILGETLPQISWQKAGIMKAGCKLFTPEEQVPEVMAVLRQQAEERNCQLITVKKDDFTVAYAHKTQSQNTRVAQAVLAHLNIPIGGLQDFYWPCRMENLRFLNQTIILDGCHNGDSVKLFLQSLHEAYPTHQKVIMFGAGIEKSVDVMVDFLFQYADKVHLVQSKHFKSYTEGQLLAKVPKGMESKLVYQPPMELSVTDNERAIGGTVAHRLLSCIRTYAVSTEQPVVIAVCGSLFVASDAREALYRLAPELFGEKDWVRFADPPM